MKLSPHFSLAELTASDTALRLGIENVPGPHETNNLLLLAHGLEKVRALLGQPIYVTSGFRCLELNRALKSKDTSHHVMGLAADFVSPSYGPPKEVCKAIRDSDIEFNQLIAEGTWAHISFAEPRKRRDVLTAHFGGGTVTYTEGIA